MRPSVPDVHITDSQDAEFAAYRALASQAVVGLIFALLAPAAFIDPGFWLIPAIGVFFGGWALRRINRDPSALTGRKLAWIGLVLSLLIAVAAPTEWLVHRCMVRSEARQITSLWVQSLMHGEPQTAHQLTVPPQKRCKPGGDVWGSYRDSPRSRKALEDYVQMPLVRTLLALGPRATTRFYDNASQSQIDGDNDLVEQVYAVTYEEEGEKRSLLVAVQAMRTRFDDGTADWRIVSANLANP
jgi:hypothetical protein